MTPAEKSDELIDKFVVKCIHRTKAKNCAIICVEQIIQGIESVIGDQKHMWREGEKEQHQYYTQVLEHIKNS